MAERSALGTLYESHNGIHVIDVPYHIGTLNDMRLIGNQDVGSKQLALADLLSPWQ